MQLWAVFDTWTEDQWFGIAPEFKIDPALEHEGGGREASISV